MTPMVRRGVKETRKAGGELFWLSITGWVSRRLCGFNTRTEQNTLLKCPKEEMDFRTT